METTYRPDEWDHWMEIIIRDGTNLTPWEKDFIEAIRLRLDAHQVISRKQEEILERIYAARTS